MTQQSKENSAARADEDHPWPVLRSFAGWRPGDLGADVVAGVTLAAIAIPSQMATARLANLTPQIGLLALVAAAIGFALFGDSRRLSVGADSTIAPIFAGALAVDEYNRLEIVTLFPDGSSTVLTLRFGD